MKTFAGLLLALLLGVAVAFIRPAQPVQVVDDVKPAFTNTGLDNPFIESDGNIHPARKCKCRSSRISTRLDTFLSRSLLDDESIL
jgi:hypothetical protein